MRPFGDGALQARVERITREQCDKLRLALEAGIVGVEVADGLEAGDPTHGFGGSTSFRIISIDLLISWKVECRGGVYILDEAREV